MTDNIEKTRPAFEAAVIERLKESGFLEIEIRVECLKPRVADGYQDEVINAGWYYWKAALAVEDAEKDEVEFRLGTAYQIVGALASGPDGNSPLFDHPEIQRVLDYLSMKEGVENPLPFDYPTTATLTDEGTKMEPTATDLLNKLAEVSAAVGFGAGEPATEIAGHFVSFLAANPVHIERFMQDAHEMVIDGTFTYDKGNLTYRAQDGTIRHPDELRAANAEKKANG